MRPTFSHSRSRDSRWGVAAIATTGILLLFASAATGQEPVAFAALEVDLPQVGAAAISLEVGGAAHEHDPLSVGRKLRSLANCIFRCSQSIR